MTRPSVNATCIMSSLKTTDFASAVVGRNDRCGVVRLLVEVVIPGLSEFRLMVFDQLTDLGQFSPIESMIGRQRHGIQAKLGQILARLNVNVRQLLL